MARLVENRELSILYEDGCLSMGFERVGSQIVNIEGDSLALNSQQARIIAAWLNATAEDIERGEKR